jgi:hypothetical protein
MLYGLHRNIKLWFCVMHIIYGDLSTRINEADAITLCQGHPNVHHHYLCFQLKTILILPYGIIVTMQQTPCPEEP